ncbi:AMP-dependent synthetase and ligase [Rhodobacteraceae bacterium KLH11]|nr:AMP-dependent synthetase and ligase [Rhodobacteraceae bacterium KLH11]
MTQNASSFHIADSTRVLTPESPGLDTLLGCLEHGRSFRASLSPDLPLRQVEGVPQCVYCESSGSSGQPKLIRRSPASWRASFDINHQLFGITPSDVYAVLGHLGHSLALYASVEALHLGCGLAALNGLGPARQAAELRRLGVTTLYATPSQLRLIVEADQSTLPGLKRVLCGGGALDQALHDRLVRHCPGAQVFEFFGASETSFITLSDSHTPAGSVGRSYPGVELRIGDMPGSGTEGEIWVQSPYLFEGYEQGHSPHTRWQDGFLSIGEVGILDADGYLYLRGRRSRMVTVADQNVFPEAIEAVLLQQDGVEAAAVLTLADARRGHRIVAMVQGTAPEATLRRACRAKLGDAAVPREIRKIGKMPMLAAGKPDLQRLLGLWQKAPI